MEAAIKPLVIEESVDGLPLRLLSDLSGAASLDLAWDTTGVAPGELASEGWQGTSWGKQGFTACPALAVASSRGSPRLLLVTTRPGNKKAATVSVTARVA